MHSHGDLIVLGGGLAGLSLALQCRQHLPEAKITVLERREHPVPEAAFKVGESTVEVAAHYFGNVLGLRQHILDDQLPKLGLRFFFPAGDNSRIEERLELGGKRYAPCPSYQLDRGRFENFLGDRCLERGIRFIDRSNIKDIDLGKRGAPHKVSYEADGKTQSVTARWVVDASGRRAFLKRQLGLQQSSPHIGNAAWFRFKKHIKIDDWCDDAKWQEGHDGKTARFYSTNHLMGKGYWVWLIPLASGSTSMGIVAAEEYHRLTEFNSLDKAIHWLEQYEPQCGKAAKANMDNIQDFRAIKHYPVECRQVFSGQRWGITGEAGFFHDPFYSPGSDFIAFSNTFLTDLIRRDLTGKGYRIRAFSYDRIYKRFYYGTASAYQDQYCMFGNPTVMPVKILWDYMIYWSITGYFFMHDRLCHQSMYLRNLSKLSRLGKLNHFMQDFFRTWHRHTEDVTAQGLVNISEMPIIREWNQQLLEDLGHREFFKAFATHIAQLETIASEIIDHSGVSAQFPFKPRVMSGVTADAFEKVLKPSKRGLPSASSTVESAAAN